MFRESRMSEQQQRSCHYILAANYAFNKLGLEPLVKAEPSRIEFLVERAIDLPTNETQTICPACKTSLRSYENAFLTSNSLIKLQDTQIWFHEECLVQMLQTEGFSQASKLGATLDITPEDLARANQALKQLIESSNDIEEILQRYSNYFDEIACRLDEDAVIKSLELHEEYDTIYSAPPAPIPQVETTESTPQAQPTPPSPTANISQAIAVFDTMFPNGFDIIPTSGAGLLCALHAICGSLGHLADSNPSIPVPTTEDLFSIIKSSEWQERMAEFELGDELMNENYFQVDQAALAAQLWAESRGFAVRLGFVIDGQAPVLLPYAPLNAECVRNADNPLIYFIHNDNVEASRPHSMNHFSGIRARNRQTGWLDWLNGRKHTKSSTCSPNQQMALAKDQLPIEMADLSDDPVSPMDMD